MAEITNRYTEKSKSAQQNGKCCQVCQHVEETRDFENVDGNKNNIRKGLTNCSTFFADYKFHCSSCSRQDVGSNITDFCYRVNTYNSAFCKVSK